MEEFKSWLVNVKKFEKEKVEDLKKNFTLKQFKELEKEFVDWYSNYTPVPVNK